MTPATMTDQPPTDADLERRGLKCRRCGCRDWRVRNTLRGADRLVRYRVCRNCGKTLKTIETGTTRGDP